MPKPIAEALIKREPRTNFQVSLCNVIHSSKGKKTATKTPISRRTSPTISLFDFRSDTMVSLFPRFPKLPRCRGRMAVVAMMLS
jgi:hypothetical protein